MVSPSAQRWYGRQAANCHRPHPVQSVNPPALRPLQPLHRHSLVVEHLLAQRQVASKGRGGGEQHRGGAHGRSQARQRGDGGL